MAEAWRRWGLIIMISVAAAPLAVLPALIAHRRAHRLAHRRGTISARGWRGWRYPLAEAGLVAGTLPWLIMVMTPVPGAGGVHVVPLADLAAVLSAAPGTAVVQVGGNLLVFAALGFFLPVRFPLRAPAIGLIACAGSVAIETAQWALHLGRVSSIDDVLLNTLGALAAAPLSHRWWRTTGSV